jgi:hypothetical protein
MIVPFHVFPNSFPFKVNRRFGGTYRLHFRGLWISQSETSIKQVASRTILDFLLGLFLDPEYRVVFLRNVSWISGDYMALYRQRWSSSQPSLWDAQISLRVDQIRTENVWTHGELNIVTWRLKAGIMEPEETFISRQRLRKQVSAATDTHAPTEELLGTM